MEGTKLNLEIIASYNMPKESYRPDYDDHGYRFTIPKSGIEVTCLFVCNGSPVENPSLEGLGGWIYIETKEELDSIWNLDYESICRKIQKEDPDFPISDFL